MIWKTKTHTYAATLCQRTAQPCPALARMARGLAQGMATANPVTDDAFQLEGSAELSHCSDGCIARFRANPDQVRVFCGTDAEAEIAGLDVFADMMFGAESTARPSTGLTPPCAMIEVLGLEQEKPMVAREPAHAQG